VERVGFKDAILTHKPAERISMKWLTSIPDHTTGINLILEALVNEKHGVIDSLSQIKAVGHRVAHGGEFFYQELPE
jgi:acetate kinase